MSEPRGPQFVPPTQPPGPPPRTAPPGPSWGPPPGRDAEANLPTPASTVALFTGWTKVDGGATVFRARNSFATIWRSARTARVIGWPGS